jgi:heavy metal translocating P-type ATPase
MPGLSSTLATGNILEPGPIGSPAMGCHLCGLPIKGTDVQYSTGSGILHFCCHGCQQVFLLLSAASGVLPDGFQETELYRACVEAGIIPAGATTRASPSNGDARLPPLEFACDVEGMWCPSCAWLIEEMLRRMAGVHDPKVSFVSDRLHLAYLPHIISPAEIIARIGRLGYRLITSNEAVAGREKDKNTVRLAVSAFLTGNIMMASVFFYGFFDVSPAVLRGFSYPVFVMASFVLFWAGMPVLKRGFASLRYGSPSMDTLISLGALSAYIYSLARMAVGGTHFYFDTAAMLITSLLFGRYIEARAKQDIRKGTSDLYRIARGKVRTSCDKGEAWVAADTIMPGQSFVVRAGEVASVDGRITGGSATVDESFLTGEPVPRGIAIGGILRAGCAVRDGEVALEAIATVKESLIGQIIATVEKALEKKDTYERLAEKFSRIFVPLVFAIAASTGLFIRISGSPTGEALLRALTVVIISCPCALGIAIPLAKVSAIAIARKAGIIIRNPDALERFPDIDTFFFDKTGTMTEGKFALRHVISDLDRGELFSRLASVEIHSRHFIGQEIVREALKDGPPIAAAEAFEAYAGRGVSGCVGGLTILIGNRALMKSKAITEDEVLDSDAAAWEKMGDTCVFFAWDGRVRGFLVFGDAVRRGAAQAIARLEEDGRDIRLISGDAETTTGAVARSLGILHFTGEVLPEGKAQRIESFRRQGRKVAMVGDGLNDAPALATADVGCAFGAGADLVQGTADIAFLSGDPGKILEARELSTLTRQTIRQNLFFAFLYNAIAIPAAVLGMLDPFIAVIAMVGSSLTVTGNVFRMAGRFRHRPENPPKNITV